MEDDVSEPRDRSWEAVAICLLVSVALFLLGSVLGAVGTDGGESLHERLESFAGAASDPHVAILILASALACFAALRTTRIDRVRVMFRVAFASALISTAAALYGIWSAAIQSSPSDTFNNGKFRTAIALIVASSGVVAFVAAWAVRHDLTMPQPRKEDE